MATRATRVFSFTLPSWLYAYADIPVLEPASLRRAEPRFIFASHLGETPRREHDNQPLGDILLRPKFLHRSAHCKHLIRALNECGESVFTEPQLVKERIMKRESKRTPREVTRRPLKLETLERREVFAVGGLDPTFAYGWGKTATELGDETSERSGSNSNIANHPHQLSLRVSGSH